MKNLKHVFSIHGLLLAIIFLMSGYIALGSNTSEAGKTSAGPLAVTLFPAHPSDLGTEKMVIQHDGSGPLDVSNWWFTNQDGVAVVITPNALASGESLVLCADMAGDAACQVSWGAEMWNDAGGTLTLYNNYGTKVITLTYANAEPGSSSREGLTYTDESKGGRPSIALCHLKKNGAMSQTIVGADALGSALDRGNGHPAHTADIIPHFYYDSGSGLTLYEGLNWPDQSGIHKNGCG